MKEQALTAALWAALEEDLAALFHFIQIDWNSGEV